MSTKKSSPRKRLFLGSPVVELLQAAAVDSYPREASGWVLGKWFTPNAVTLHWVFPVQQADHRDNENVDISTAEDIVQPILHDYIVGGFHSHISWPPTMSSADKKVCDDMEVIITIREGKRNKWLFQVAAYYEEDGKWHRMEVVT